MTRGHATAEGTRRYHARFAAHVATDHVRLAEVDWTPPPHSQLALSSIGIGTYLGAPDDDRDRGYAEAIARALAVGIDVVDTASNYRQGRSERVVGATLAEAFANGFARDEIFVASKVGFVDGGGHSLDPQFVYDTLERSRERLGLDTIDCYYLHNPEAEFAKHDRGAVHAQIFGAFSVLEKAVEAGRIRAYGIATWDGLRVMPDHRDHLDLYELHAMAQQLGGERHHFAFVQLPINPQMHEAMSTPTQRGRTVLDAARELGLYVMASAAIGQGRLPGTLAETRTLPGLGTALVGMSSRAHVDENACTFRRPS